MNTGAQCWCTENRLCPILVSAALIFTNLQLLGLAFCTGLRYQTPMNKESIENLAQRLAAAVPEGYDGIQVPGGCFFRLAAG